MASKRHHGGGQKTILSFFARKPGAVAAPKPEGALAEPLDQPSEGPSLNERHRLEQPVSATAPQEHPVDEPAGEPADETGTEADAPIDERAEEDEQS